MRYISGLKTLAKDFYHYNAKGTYMSNTETDELFKKINKNGNYPIYP